MKRLLTVGRACSLMLAGLCLCIGRIPHAAAQGNLPAAGVVNAPAQTNIALPLPAQGQEAVFPVLPYSNRCAGKDIFGMWKLAHVYEVPPQIELESFSSNPVQYIFFRYNGTYGTYAGQADIPLIDVRNAINQPQTTLQQFVLNSGFVYFYKDGSASDTQACFIVAAASGDFKPGELLLMPPQGTVKGRLMKVYQRPKPPAPVPPAPRGLNP